MTLLVRLCHIVYGYVAKVCATYPRWTILLCLAFTVAMTIKMATTPQISAMDGYASDDARSRQEYNSFQQFLNSDGEGITIGLLIRAPNNESMMKLEYFNETIQLLDMVATSFPMYDADLKKNQSFDEFCNGFCQANDPVRQYFNGLQILSTTGNDSLSTRIDLKYPQSTMFGRKFSLMPNFFGVETEADGTVKHVTMIILIFRAEKHRAWLKQQVKDYEVSIGDYFHREYESPNNLNIKVFSAAIVEKEIVRAGDSLYPFLGIGFGIMSVFCSLTTIFSGVNMYGQKATVNKVILSVLACVNPFLACGAALGVLFFLHVNFSPLLAITPFLVLAISVDDSFLMIHAWNRLQFKQPQMSRIDKISEVLVETGPAITISGMTNILAFLIGAMTSPQEIRIFCYGNAACIFFDVVFQATFYAACMTIFADEMDVEGEFKKPPTTPAKVLVKKVLKKYLNLWKKPITSYICLVVWLFYITISIYGLTQVYVDLSSDRMFLPDSPVVEIDRTRTRIVVPHYTPATIVVNNPGDLSNETNIQGLIDMKKSFESIPGAIGPLSTKFFLEDLMEYRSSIEELDDDEADNSIEAFLEWPEYSFWKGFVSVGHKKLDENRTETVIDKFMFTTGYHGDELMSWAGRGAMLARWRDEVDKFQQFNATVYSDDGFYVDLLLAIPTLTWQSMVITFLCMILVCAFFIGHLYTVFVVSGAILSTCTGVFGILSLLGITLDPVMMSISIMCIGFSVDIPAHVSFHYHATKSHKKEVTSSTASTKIFMEEQKIQTQTPRVTIDDRLQHTLSAVGFPVIQAGISTDLCTLPLAFVNLYMAQVFALSMMLCVTLSLIHGLIFIPMLFCLQDHVTKLICRRR